MMILLYHPTDGWDSRNVETMTNMCHRYDEWCAMVGYGGSWLVCDMASPHRLSAYYDDRISTPIRTYIPASTLYYIGVYKLNCYLFPSDSTVTS